MLAPGVLLGTLDEGKPKPAVQFRLAPGRRLGVAHVRHLTRRGRTMTALPSLAVEEVPIDDLHPEPADPRRVGDEELEALERSLR